jgi:hypothetical protein
MGSAKVNSTEYRAILKTLGLSQRGCAKFFDCNPTTGQRWAKDGPPPSVAVWLRFMLAVHTHMHIEDVPAWVNRMIGRE